MPETNAVYEQLALALDRLPNGFPRTGSGVEIQILEQIFLCVTGCPNDTARLERKPEGETIQPPANFTAWEQEGLRSRGLAN